MDLNREIKLSDLFKRRPKAAADEARIEAAPAGAPDAGERKSLLKRDLSDLFRRGPKAAAGGVAASAPTEPASESKSLLKRELSFGRRRNDTDADGIPVEPKAPKQSNERRRGRGKPAQALPAVPLMRAFDLLPKDDPRQAGGRTPSRAQLALAVAGLVLIAALASIFLKTNARVADKERERDDLREQLAARNVPAEEPKPTGGDPALAQERDRRTAALAAALGGRIAWDRVLREFALVLPDDVWLKSMAATGGTAAPAGDPNAAATPTTLQLNGYTEKQDGVARLLSRMAVLPELDNVQLLSSTTVELEGEEVVEFTISAAVKPPTPGGTA